MSGSLKIPMPTFNPIWPDPALNVAGRPAEDRIAMEKRQAAIKLLLTLYNEYPLRKGEEPLMDVRILLLNYAERGWFRLLERDCEGASFPPEQLRAGLALLA